MICLENILRFYLKIIIENNEGLSTKKKKREGRIYFSVKFT